MNNLCPPHLLTSSGAQLIPASQAMQLTSISSVQAPTTLVPAMSGVMSSVPMPVGAIAIPGGATLHTVAVQAANLAIRQGTPIGQPNQSTSGEQTNPAIGQQIFTQAMIPVSQNNAMPLNFHIPQQSKDANGANVTNLITTMAQTLNNDATHQNLVHSTLAHQQQQQQQAQQGLQQQQPQQPQQQQQQQQHLPQQHQILAAHHLAKIDPSTVSTIGLGLTSDMALHASQLNPHLLAAVAPGIQPPTSIPPQPLPTTDASGSPPKKKKKKKSKKSKVPTSLTPSSSSIPEKLVTYKPNCGESDMEAFMAYQRLCNTHLDLKAKLHLLYNSRHSCQLCHREFKGFCRLRRHLQSHADFRPYKCESCNKRFYNVSKLKRHNLVHSGLKPYKCPMCDSSLSRREHLKRHMLTHSEERPYRCSGCDYSSRRLDGVHKHIKGKHSGTDHKVMYVKPQIFDLLSHDLTVKAAAAAGEGKEGSNSTVLDPLTDKDAFLHLMMGNIKFSQLLTSGTTPASNSPVQLEDGSSPPKSRKKKKRKSSFPTQVLKPGDGGSLPVINVPVVNPYSQNIGQNQQGDVLITGTSQNLLAAPPHPNGQDEIKQEAGTPQPQGSSSAPGHSQTSPMPQFNNYPGAATQPSSQGQQFFPAAHLGTNQSAFQSVYSGGTYEAKYFGPGPPNAVLAPPEHFTGPGGMPPFFRRPVEDLAPLQLSKKSFPQQQ